MLLGKPPAAKVRSPPAARRTEPPAMASMLPSNVALVRATVRSPVVVETSIAPGVLSTSTRIEAALTSKMSPPDWAVIEPIWLGPPRVMDAGATPVGPVCKQ